eukprot:COSAG06_NODE_4799_length_3945_cov_8.420376_4_plen_69_part_00
MCLNRWINGRPRLSIYRCIAGRSRQRTASRVRTLEQATVGTYVSTALRCTALYYTELYTDIELYTELS